MTVNTCLQSYQVSKSWYIEKQYLFTYTLLKAIKSNGFTDSCTLLLQVDETYSTVDDLTREFTQAVHDSSLEARTTFQPLFAAFSAQTLDAIHEGRNSDKSALVERHLLDMIRIDWQLLTLMTERKSIFLGLNDFIITCTLVCVQW